jgi:tagaturonate reductase
VEASCVFANTLVDRIVPGRPSPEESAAIFAELGYEDSMMVAAEPSLLRHRGSGKGMGRPPLRRRAERRLGQGHPALPHAQGQDAQRHAHGERLGAFLGGIDTVREMMEHPSFGRLARKSLYEELLPTVPLPEAESKAFADSVVERFLNPFIRHELISISLNSVSKWKVRVLPALLDTVKSGKGLPPCLAFSLAALAVFYRGPLSAAGDSIQGSRHMVKDDPQALKAFVSAWRAGDVAKLADAILPDASLWGVDLTSVQGLRERFVRDVENILELGAEKAARIAGGL